MLNLVKSSSTSMEMGRLFDDRNNVGSVDRPPISMVTSIVNVLIFSTKKQKENTERKCVDKRQKNGFFFQVITII